MMTLYTLFKKTLANVNENGLALKNASDELKNNKEIVLAAVKQYCGALQYASDKLKADLEIVFTAIKNGWWTLKYASDEFNADKEILEIVVDIVKHNHLDLEFDSKGLLANREIVSFSVQQDWRALKYASDELKSDKEIILTAVQQDWRTLEYASKEFVNDQESMLATVSQNGLALKYASNELKNDKEVVLAAISQNGLALKYTNDELKNDKEVVVVAVSQNGLVLEYASDELKNDKEIVLAAISQNGLALKYTNDELKNDKEVVVAVSQNGLALKYASNELKNDKEIVLAAISQNGLALKYASNTLQRDRKTVITAVSENVNALEYASYIVKNDLILKSMIGNQDFDFNNYRDFAIKFLNENGNALENASDELKSDHDIVIVAVRQNSYALSYANYKLQHNKEFIIKVLKHNGLAIQYVGKELKNDIDIIIAAVSQDGNAIQYVSDVILKDKELVLKCVESNWKCLIQLINRTKLEESWLIEAYRQDPSSLQTLNHQNFLPHDWLLETIEKQLIQNSEYKTPTSPEIYEAINLMNEKKQAVSYIKEQMERSYLDIDSKYQDQEKRIYSCISQEEFNQLKIEFIHDWYNRKIPEDYKNRISIDDQQALAIGTVHGNVKVTARAGSGKTATLVLRALFLHFNCRIDWSQMLVMAFNKEAAVEINERLNKYIGSITNKPVEKEEDKVKIAYTFHSFATGIVKSARNYINLITDDDSSQQNSDKTPKKIIQGIFQNKIKNDHVQLSKVKKIIFEHSTHFGDDIAEKDSYSNKRKGNPIDSKGLDGIRYSSSEDLMIANWLFCCGLTFQYQKQIKNYGNSYKVSFILDKKNPQGKNYAIESNSDIKNQLKDSLEFVEVSQDDLERVMEALNHSLDCDECNNNRTECRPRCRPSPQCPKPRYSCAILSCTGLCDGCNRCPKHGTCIETSTLKANFKSNEEIWSRMRDSFLKDFEKTIQGFIERCRNLRITPEQLTNKIEEYEFRPEYTKDFAEIAQLVYHEYMNELDENDVIDFTKIVDLACDYLHAGEHKFDSGKKDVKQLKFLFIDEFQDFSLLFNDLTQGIIKNNPNVQSFCVGDDWQAINGFAGSDLRYFNNFSSKFKNAIELNMVTNYRSGKNIVTLGNNIMKGFGAEGIAKPDAGSGNVYLVDPNEFILTTQEKAYFDGDEVSPLLLRLINNIISREHDVMILSRNNNPRVGWLKFDDNDRSIQALVKQLKRLFLDEIVIVDNESVTISPSLKIKEGSTVHTAKGMQSKSIILITPHAFPSIHPDWIFQKVLGETLEEIIKSERRLFYVAVTRAEHDLYMLNISSGKNYGQFVEKEAWEDKLGILSKINPEDYPSIPFQLDGVHVKVKTPDGFGATKFNEFRKIHFKNKGFEWSGNDKVWSRNYSINQLKNLEDYWTELCNDIPKDYWKELSNDIPKDNHDAFEIDVEYNGNSLFREKSSQKPKFDDGLYYFMNLLAAGNVDALIHKIQQSTLDLLNIVNKRGENILFYLVNYDVSKLARVLNILHDLLSTEEFNRRLSVKNKSENNIFDKSVIIGNYPVVEYLLINHSGLVCFNETEKTYKTKNHNVHRLLESKNISSKVEDVVQISFDRYANELDKAIANFYVFLNWKLSLPIMLNFLIKHRHTKSNEYLNKILKVVEQRELQSALEMEELTNLPLDIMTLIECYRTNEDAEMISSAISLKKITKLVHFTNVNNLDNIFEHKGIYSLNKLNENKIKYKQTDHKRLDGLTNYICCSISKINSYYLKEVMQREKYSDFCIIKLSPNMIYKHGSLYCLTNAANERNNLALDYTNDNAEAFLNMFQERQNINGRSFKRNAELPDYHTTDEQAEVLVQGGIHVSLITEIVFKNEGDKNHCENRLKEKHKQIDWIKLTHDASQFRKAESKPLIEIKPNEVNLVEPKLQDDDFSF